MENRGRKGMKKKYQIFISSTYTDLIEERAKVRDTILSMGHFPVGMENFGAANDEQWKIIKDMIDCSDYYVLIVGQRYGSVIEKGADKGISYTEKEFNYAMKKKVPILAFIIDDSVSVLPAKIERNYKDELEAFKKKVCTDRTVKWWKNKDDLASDVSVSLHNEIARTERPGWVRAESFDLEDSHAELLALNKENRILREEIHKLRDQIQVRKPELAVSFEPYSGNEADYRTVQKNEDGSFNIGFPEVEKIDFEILKNKYKKISMHDVPMDLRFRINRQDIEKYNEKLPDENVLQNYIEQDYFVKRIKKGYRINFKVRNNGTARANNIKIMITLPDELMFMDYNTLKKYQEPKEPSLPENPITRALYGAPLVGKGWLDSLTNPVTIKPSLMDSLVGGSLTSGINIRFENNSSDIRIDKIIHTDSESIKEFYFVPSKKGTFQVKCQIMCEEYLRPDVQYFTFHVE